jgi:multidrug efflux pump subunit AcrA (membrane-fusion protein)
MRVSRSTSVIVGVFALVMLVLAVALSTALNRIEQLEGAMPTAGDVDRDRQQLREEIEALRSQLDAERTKNVALEAALELARARAQRPFTNDKVDDASPNRPTPSEPTTSNP